LIAATQWLKDSAPIELGVGFARHAAGLEAEAASYDLAAIPASFRPLRRRTFLLGRAAVRTAYEDLGVRPAPLPRDSYGRPAWPSGLTGSLSHSDDLAVAIVCRKISDLAVGIDIEALDRELRPEVFERILLPEERGSVLHKRGLADPEAARAIFCAKEAAFKACSSRLSAGSGFWNVALRPAAADLYLASVRGVDLPECRVEVAVFDLHVLAFAVLRAPH
jgi:4'-phosphopantetheinyl transferase EntD